MRGGAELRNLRAGENSQFRLEFQEGNEVLIYKETKAKNYQGNAKSLRKNPPPDCVIHHNENHERCCVCFYKKLINGRPKDCRSNAVFLKPLAKPKGQVLFTNIPVDYHTVHWITSSQQSPQDFKNVLPINQRGKLPLLACTKKTFLNK